MVIQAYSNGDKANRRPHYQDNRFERSYRLVYYPYRLQFSTLVGHVAYDAALDLTYALLDWLWHGLFIKSDPIKRMIKGPGAPTFFSLGQGIIASIG